jgi:hypothetical protein
MTVEEFDTSLSDLETRVDRLRALYENWFRGYEKMEPSVARKDVERRVYALRKELPRNTALRFRYHQLYQRYTTLATYWQRTARQIEEGTYRLQLQRMKRRRVDVDDDDMRTLAPRQRASDDLESLAPPGYELNLDETLDVRQLLDEIDLDQVARSITVSATKQASSAPAPTPPQAPARTVQRFARPSMTSMPPGMRSPSPASGAPLEGEGEQLEGLHTPSRAPAPRPQQTLSPPSARALEGAPLAGPPSEGALRPPEPSAGAPRVTATFGKPPPLKIPPLAAPSMLKSGPGTGTLSIPGGPGQPSMPPLGARPPPPGASQGPGTGSARMVPPVPGPGTGSAHRVVPPLPGAGGAPPRPLPPPSAPSVAHAPQSPPATVTGSGTTPRAPGSPPPATASGSGATRAAVGPPSAAAPRTPASAPAAVPGGAAPAPRPPLGMPSGAPHARAPATPPASAPGPAARAPMPGRPTAAPQSSADALPEPRMRRLYDEYAAARRKNNEGDVRYETLASSIQKMLPDLSKKHQGKQIDFEVVLKDGRVGLKPKAT